MLWVEWGLFIAAAYLAAGVLFALLFVVSGIHRVDPLARGSSLGFRVAVFPGVTAFWPVLVRRWMRAL